MLFDVIDRVLHGRDLLGVVVRNLDVELFFECHDELDDVEGVGTEVVGETGVRLDFVCVDTKLVRDDALDLICNGHG